MADAAQEDAAVLVLPELSISDYAPICQALEQAKLAALIVPGSRAERSPQGGYRNIASLWYCGRHLFDHEKVHGMYAASQPTRDGECPWPRGEPEQLIPGQSLTLLWSPQWIVTTVICADLFSPRIEEALLKTKANLILAPLLTPVLGVFPETMRNFAIKNQAITIASNSVLRGGAISDTSAMSTPMTPSPDWSHEDSGVLHIHDW